MKKLLTLSLALLLAFSIVGCGEKKANLIEFTTYPNSELLYPAPLNLDWGMSKDEAFKALGMTADQATLHPFDKSELSNSVLLNEDAEADRDIYTTEVTCDGAKICVVLRFANQEHIKKYGTDYGLVSAEIAFNGQDVFNKVKESVSKNTTKKIAEACDTAGITDEMLAFLDKRLSATRSTETANSSDDSSASSVEIFGKEPLASASVPQGSDDKISIDGKDYEYITFYRGLNAAFYNVTIKEKSTSK